MVNGNMHIQWRQERISSASEEIAIESQWRTDFLFSCSLMSGYIQLTLQRNEYAQSFSKDTNLLSLLYCFRKLNRLLADSFESRALTITLFSKTGAAASRCE